MLRDSEETCFIIYKSTVFWLFVAAACPDTKIALCCWTVGLHSPTGHGLVYEIPNCFLAIFCFSSVRGLTGHSQLFWEQYFRSSACTCVTYCKYSSSHLKGYSTKYNIWIVFTGSTKWKKQSQRKLHVIRQIASSDVKWRWWFGLFINFP